MKPFIFLFSLLHASNAATHNPTIASFAFMSFYFAFPNKYNSPNPNESPLKSEDFSWPFSLT